VSYCSVYKQIAKGMVCCFVQWNAFHSANKHRDHLYFLMAFDFILSCLLGGLCLQTKRDGDRLLQLLICNEAFLVSVSHQLALITSLPFVHTARRYYRLSVPVNNLDCRIVKVLTLQ